MKHQELTACLASAQEGMRVLQVDALFKQLQPLSRIGSERGLEIQLDSGTYDPKQDPLFDWVHRVAIPAFQMVARCRQVRRFCTVGTGTGCDALAAIEIFSPRLVAMTDLESSTVDLAAGNVARNLRAGHAIEIRTGVGDLLMPFAGWDRRFDVIYENLPNIPLGPIDQRLLDHGRNRASYHARREEPIPALVKENLLELHWLCLDQARDLLADSGIVLSSIGARRPIAEIRRAMAAPGFEQCVELYSWKAQSEPEEVIGGFAGHERFNRHFHFYPIEILARAFEGLTELTAAEFVLDIEAALRPVQLSAAEALQRSRSGEPIGHTVVVLSSHTTDGAT